MMRWRFINLVMKDYAVDGSYWLSRMRPQENLFYASSVEAMTAQAQARKDKVNAMLPFGSTLELPPPAARFKSSCTDCLTLDFMPFYGRDSPGEGRIAALDSTGHTVLYDADGDPCSVEMLPRVNSSNWRTPISLCVTGANQTRFVGEREAPTCSTTSTCSTRATSRRSSTATPPALSLGGSTELKLGIGSSSGRWPTLVIQVRITPSSRTHCSRTGKPSASPPQPATMAASAPTASTRPATSGPRPPAGRCPSSAVHGTSLSSGNLWFGFSGSNPNNICAVDLCSLDGPPKVLHEWRGPNTPRNWMLTSSTMVYLGGNRFCVVRFFSVYNGPPDRNDEPTDTVSIITGLEIVKGQTSETVLRMVKHKSRTYVFEGCGIESVF
ncbi:hypothetical protein CFC21_022192 [Triticum aestivum]|uniref:Uncharacterized protein n=2 Tax=Triticum aestivum TaxID=4565 RepID=A0A3B6C1K8_WHEAT|nr:hypothetical protein CFC21_022192 [Triticum aestivum]